MCGKAFVQEVAERSIRISFRNEDHWIAVSKCQRNIGLLIICIGDLETEVTLLDPLSKSVSQTQCDRSATGTIVDLSP